jgi:hypothetical protein
VPINDHSLKSRARPLRAVAAPTAPEGRDHQRARPHRTGPAGRRARGYGIVPPETEQLAPRRARRESGAARTAPALPLLASMR